MKYANNFAAIFFLGLILTLTSCKTPGNKPDKGQDSLPEDKGKIVVYQVFTRLFGNTETLNTAWGTREENGCGKFADFDDTALEALKDLGITHIWYTGVPHHAMVQGYPEHGIEGDDPDVVKGRAGSPYAVKDYYNVNPDLATDPALRLEEFEELISRTHNHGLKVVIDIVPNHVARNYHSLVKPEEVRDLGADDDRSLAYARNNDFYYIPGEPFRVPEWRDGYRVLGGEAHPLADGSYQEDPARWTGNGSRSAQPDMYDWYETIKVNFGIKPDGSKDFPQLPEGYGEKSTEEHLSFWKDKEVPGSWVKFKDIALFWLEKGVDGFRYDMAEMVPVEFWSYMNSHIKQHQPDAFLLAEIYQPAIYRDYIRIGKMDYLYDKVQLYDSLKAIMQGHGSTDALAQIQRDGADIEGHMLHFLENHDEQRIASPEFAGDARKGMPAMVVSACLGSSPTMIYFGQHAGEKGAEDAGYGKPSRTSIFDYIGVPAHQQWVSGGRFDGSSLDAQQKELHDFYSRLLNFTRDSKALTGKYFDLHSLNRKAGKGYGDKHFAFARWRERDRLLIISSFEAEGKSEIELLLPPELLTLWELSEGSYTLEEQLGGREHMLVVSGDQGRVYLSLPPLGSLVLKLGAGEPTSPLPPLFGQQKKKMDRELWESSRRGEILALFEEHVYGHIPEIDLQTSYPELENVSSALGGKAERKQVKIQVSDGHDSLEMDLLIYLPTQRSGPVPLFLGLNFYGNHTINEDPGIWLPESELRISKSLNINSPIADDASRGMRASRWPVELILSKGYGLATLYCGDIDKDVDDAFSGGAHKLDKSQRGPSSWGTIAAWSWGLSRAMDYFETDKDLDASGVAVIGHSRLGKTALWAGARDQRFAMVVSNNSGCGGAALSRREVGESVERITRVFPHWFAQKFTDYANHEEACPVDQHMLLALVAPRPLYVVSATLDTWADPTGEYLSLYHGSRAWALYGESVLDSELPPPADKPRVAGKVCYHIRTGKHDITTWDWEQYLDFAEKNRK